MSAILVVVKICSILIRFKSLKIQSISFQNTIEFIINTNDVITDKIPPYFKQYMLQLANYDDDLQYFLFQHTAVLLTADTKYRRGLILYGGAKNGKSVYIELVKSFFYSKDIVSKPLNELEGRFDKESLIDKSLMASHEIGQSRIQEKIVNDFKSYYL